MYSPDFTEQAVQSLAQKTGWTPRRYTIAQVEKAVAHLDTLTEYDKDGNAIGWKEQPSPEWQEFIRNERLLCKLDFHYFVTRYGFISDRENREMRFTPNLAQSIVLDVMGQLEVAMVAIILLFLKARQLGISTLAALLVLHRVIFTLGLKSVLGSSDPKRSQKLARMFWFAWDRVPWWMRPVRGKYAEYDYYEFGGGGFLDIAWGNKKTGIARGDTPTVGWLSELAEFENVEEKVDASLVRAMHENPNMLLVCETTARGPGDWLNKTWDESVAGLADNSNYYFPIFLPWYVGRDLYPNPHRLRRQPVPEGWVPPQHIKDHAQKAKEYVAATPLLQKYLGDDWEMPIEQMWFYHIEYQRAKRKNDLPTFFHEMPSSALEAFSSPHGGIFDTEQIIELQNTCREPVAVYGIEGPEITLPVKPSDIDRNSEPFEVTVNWSRQYPAATYRFIPLKFSGSAQSYDFNGKLAVYEFPKDDEDYTAGVDTSHGRERDFSVINIGRMWTPARPYREQVAVFASNQVNHAYLWPFGMAIGTWYSTKKLGRVRQCKFGIEVPNGDPMWQEMQNRGWYEFFRQVAEDKAKPNLRGAKIGFATSRYSRVNLMSEFSRAVLERIYRIHHQPLLKDMSALVWNHDKGKLEARTGAHDDQFFAAAIEYQTGEQFETQAGRTSVYVAREEARAKEGEYPTFDPGSFGRIDLEELR